VEHATTGRRHSRAGSITVAELIRKQPVPIRIPSCEEADTDGFVHDLLGPPHQRTARPGKARTVAKLAGIATGALVLCTSVTVASLTARDRPAVDASARLARPAEISGANALLPSFLDRQLRLPGTDGADPAENSTAATNANARPGGPTATRTSGTGSICRPGRGPTTGPVNGSAAPSAFTTTPPRSTVCRCS
jgi:hypothetical protein